MPTSRTAARFSSGPSPAARTNRSSSAAGSFEPDSSRLRRAAQRYVIFPLPRRRPALSGARPVPPPPGLPTTGGKLLGEFDSGRLRWTDGDCIYCRSNRENLCDRARFTGYTLDGGYAEYALADQRFCFAIPDSYSDTEAAPLMCAGLIGYRSLMKAGEGKRLGIYGFGAAAHIIAQVASYQNREIYAFSRPGDEAAKEFALGLGAVWAGSSSELPPVKLDAAIIFAPAGELVPQALRALKKGGTVVCGGIHMSDIPSFPYSILWQERSICSVANLTRRDGEEFLPLAPLVPVRTQVETFPLEEANEALARLRSGNITGAAVLVLDHRR